MEIKIRWTPKLIGVVGAALLLGFYASILTLFNGVNHTIEQFEMYWYFIIPLVVGFGIQLGLVAFMHYKSKASGMAKVSGAMSAGSMVACCAHHITDFVPLLGVSAVGLFLADYTPVFLLFGVLSNVIGILFMLRELQKHGLLKDIMYLPSLNFDVAFKAGLGMSAVVFVAYFIMFQAPGSGLDVTALASLPASSLQTLTDSQLDVVFDVTPRVENGAVLFDIGINNHQYDVAFDIVKESSLEINGQAWTSLSSWVGAPISGHHVSGTLVFEGVSQDVLRLKLVVQLLGTTRTFEWKDI
ncbi:hypothetical protein COT72_00210 [archaeon CG10_big_fil_rev_8_21_14_0_10_43_11]|nr:MAG: hypothetical protein COT72_00210 [archaeon CG10_big_fil_rev_8_21_14_0_10_43_11]